MQAAAAMADLDAKVRAFLVDAELEDSNGHHTFAQRAESYYQKRPHLLSLLRHLHSAYLCLLHSTNNSSHHHTTKQQRRLITLHRHRLDDTSDDDDDNFTSDDGGSAESTTQHSTDSSSSVSKYYSPPPPRASINTNPNTNNSPLIVDAVVTEMVVRGVEYELLAHEMGASRARAESALRRCELQGSLVEVLESERRVLASENTELRWRVEVLAEEGEGLAEESAFLRRKVGELAAGMRTVKREEARMVGVLTRKVEELRSQLYGMERWSTRAKKVAAEEEGKMMCGKCRERESGSTTTSGDKVGRKWWGKVKGIPEFFLCGGPNCTDGGGGGKIGGGGGGGRSRD